MTSGQTQYLMEKYSKSHLVCDTSYPLITNTTLEEEALLYNLDNSALNQVIDEFITLAGKQISASYDINNLSGGQKVILMVLLALYSPASRIVFMHLDTSLDTARLQSVRELIDRFKPLKLEIMLEAIS